MPLSQEKIAAIKAKVAKKASEAKLKKQIAELAKKVPNIIAFTAHQWAKGDLKAELYYLAKSLTKRDHVVFNALWGIREEQENGRKPPKALMHALNRRADKSERAAYVIAALKRPEVAKWVKDSGAWTQKEIRQVTKLHNDDFWRTIGDAVATVANQPIFQAVCTVATAAIPGVGLALAPMVPAAMGAANAAYKSATGFQAKVPAAELQGMAGAALSGSGIGGSGSIDVKGAISGAIGKAPQTAASVALSQMVATMKAKGASAKQIKKAVQAQVNLAKLGVAAKKGHKKAQKAVHLIRGLANPKGFIALKIARNLLVKAQAGDKKAKITISKLTLGAKRGDPGCLRAMGTIAAVTVGMQQGSVPLATPEERRSMIHLVPQPRKRLCECPPEGLDEDEELEDEEEAEELEDDSEVFEDEAEDEEDESEDGYEDRLPAYQYLEA